jgi:hypothetical protein
MQYIHIIDIIAVDTRLLDLFKTVSPYSNKLNRHIMDTEKVHSIQHCHVDVTIYANPLNCCCNGPEGGHKTWVHEQGLKTNQGSSSTKTLMTHSLNKEASQLLCDAVLCRVEDGDASAENWTDSKGEALAPDSFWSSGIESEIAGDDEGPCKGIELNIWERAKMIFCIIIFIYIICIICIIFIIAWHARYVVTSRARWWAAGANMGYLMLLITAKSGMEVLAGWAHMKFSLFCPTGLRGFCSSFTVIDLKASISRSYSQTEVSLMCTELFWMIRYFNMSYFEG